MVQTWGRLASGFPSVRVQGRPAAEPAPASPAIEMMPFSHGASVVTVSQSRAAMATSKPGVTAIVVVLDRVGLDGVPAMDEMVSVCPPVMAVALMTVASSVAEQSRFGTFASTSGREE